MMQRILHPNGVVTYSFEQLAQQRVRAHVSTRHGGVSPAPWNTLNFSVLRGDTRERVEENRRRFATAVGVDPTHVTHARQVHGTGVAKVGWDEVGQTMDGCDALVTDAVGLPLSVVFADCVPILLYDPTHHALGVCHAGWRGTVNGAGVATLWAMVAAYVGQLVEAGVNSHHIEVSGIDTAQQTDDFYSHRAEAGRCGLFAMMAWLTPPV
jgi:hypothetical protein